MGKQKYQEQIMDLFNKSPVVSFNSIQRIINKTSKSSQYAKQLIRNLVLKNKVKKITKGYYTTLDDPSLLVFCIKPAYLGLQDALSINNLWEQETIPIILTSRKVRQGIRKIFNTNVLVRKVNKKYVFGISYKKHDNFYLPYSDIEKTFIDMIYFKEKLSPETLNLLKNKLNKKTLNSYLKKYPIMIKKRVLSALKN